MKDKLGILFSSACIAHCVAVPMITLLVGTNTFISALANEWLHVAIMLPVFLMLALSLPHTWLRTRQPKLLAFSIVGVCCLLASRGVHGISEIVFTVIGSVMIILAHRLSLKLSQSADHSESVTC